MRKQQARALGLIIAAGTLVASAPVMAQGADSAMLKKLQEQIQMLQQQVQTLQQQQARNTNSPYPDNAGTESTALQNAAGDVGVEENPGAETQTAEVSGEENQTEQVASGVIGQYWPSWCQGTSSPIWAGLQKSWPPQRMISGPRIAAT